MAIEPPMVKICGLTRAGDAAQAAALGAWGVGVVFAENSPRRVTIEQATEVFSGVSPFTSRVGVFVAPEADEVREVVERCQISLAQIHGHFDVEQLKAAAGVMVIQAFKVDGPATIAAAKESPADLVLLDASVPGMDGGTGETFEWSLIEGEPFGRPFMLAGGLNPDNVAEAVSRVRPDIIDVSSGVEASPGVKDPELLQAFARGVAHGASIAE